MLQGEWAQSGEHPVVAGDIAVYRDLVAERLGIRGVATARVGDARLVVLCPDGNGLSQVESLAADPRRKVIVLAAARERVHAYWEAGAFSVLPYEATTEELRRAVERAARDECDIPTDVARFLLDRLRTLRARVGGGRVDRLTPRELEVAQLMADGFRNKQIAKQLWISEATVKKHVNKVLAKLEVGTRREVASCLRREQEFRTTAAPVLEPSQPRF
jgi:DNA-binding NarL/FixJ family response regulator